MSIMTNEEQFLYRVRESLDRINVSTEELKEAVNDLVTEDSVIINYSDKIRTLKHILYSVNYELDMNYIGMKAYLGSKDE